MEGSGSTRESIPCLTPSRICIFIFGCFLLTSLGTGATSIKCPVPAKKPTINEDLQNLEDCPLIDQSKMPLNVTDCARESGMSKLCLAFGTGRGLAPKGLIACFSRYKEMIDTCRNDTSSFQGQLIDVRTMMRCRFRPSFAKVTTPKRFSFFF